VGDLAIGNLGNGIENLLRALAVAVASLVLVCASLFAQGTDPTNAGSAILPATQSAQQATTYKPGDLYLPGSRVYVFVGKTGFGHEHGVTGQLQASKLQLDATQDAGQLVFDMKSFVADTDRARKYVGLAGTTPATTQQEVNTNMLGSAVLDVSHYPTASFAVRSSKRLPQPSARGLTQYQLQGDFTLHGTSRPILVVAEAEEQGGWIHLRGGFSLLQSQYGMTPFNKVFGAVGVADQVNVYGDFWIAKQQAVATAGAPGNR